MSDLVFNPEYSFSHAVVISSRIERVYYIHVLSYTIQGCLYYVTFLPQNMNISSHCTIGKHAYGTCLNGYANFSSLFLYAINVAILGNSKSNL